MYTREVGELAHKNNLSLHIDGARIFNAAAAQNISVRDLVEPADSVMFCLSKGLASPIGSMLVGTDKFITRARHVRKMLGGGMRQVGIVAAAGIISLEKMTKRLADDHTRARKLADGLRQVNGILVDEGSPFSNMVYLNLANDVKADTKAVVEKILKFGVLLDAENARRFRLVTHYWVDDDAVDKVIKAFESVLV